MSDNLPTKFDAELRHRFLQVYALTGQIQKSAQTVGISPTTVRNLAKKDTEFADALAEAKADFAEAVEREVVRRAVMGWDEPVYQKGELVGEVRKHSDQLLMMLMKKLDPSYKEGFQVDVNIGGGLLAAPAKETAEEWEKRNSLDADFDEIETTPSEEQE